MRELKYKKLLSTLVFSIITTLALVVFFIAPTNAVDNTGPDESDFYSSPNNIYTGNGSRDMRFLLDSGGVGALESVFAVYSRTSTVSVTIRSPGICNDGGGYGDGGGTEAENILTIYTIESYATPGSIYGTRNVNSCLATTTLSAVTSEPPVVIGGITWYRALVRAEFGPVGLGKGNSFDVVANGAGSVVSYYSLSGNEFVIQDRGLTNCSASNANLGNCEPRLTTYNLKFGTECSITSNTPATLEWFDDDRASIIQNQAKFGYRMMLIERTRAGARTFDDYYLNNDGSTNFLAPRSGWSTTNHEDGWATFMAKPDHKYEWIWEGVVRHNALQFELPFDSIYYEHGCDTWEYDLSPLSVIGGTRNGSTGGTPIYDVQQGQSFGIRSTVTNEGTLRGDVYNHIMRPTNATENAEMYANLTRSGFSDNGVPYPNPMGYKVYPAPALDPGRSATRTANYNVKPVGQSAVGTVMCWWGTLVPADQSGTRYESPASERVCVRVVAPPTEWNYGPIVSPLADRYPGEEFNVTSRVTNSGNGNGLNYTHIVESWGGESNLSTVNSGDDPITNGVWNQENDARWLNQAGLNAFGGNQARTGRWKVNDNASPGDTVCFRSSANPSRGNGATVTRNRAESPEVCFTIKENRRFGMSSTVGLASAAGVVTPGGNAVFNVYVTNNGPSQNYRDQGSTADVYPFAVHDRARGINCSFTATNGSVQGSPSCFSTPAANADAYGGTVTVSVPGTANVGDPVCLTASGTALNGFSYGASTDYNGSFTDTDCYVVGISPYLQVNDGDVWAGANFDDSSPALNPETLPASCGGPAHDDSKIESVTSNISTLWRGSFVEYAAYATGSISGFGSNDAPNLTTLTFANTDLANLGDYTNSPKCIANYFELLSPPNHTYAPPDTSTSNGNNLNSVTDAEEQSYVNPNDGTFDIQGGNTNLSGNRTLVVEGNLHISTDVTFSNYNYNNSNNLDVPSLILVVSGDIFIDAAVETIDAILISHGTVWTCSSGGSATVAVAEGVCTNQLTINGAIVANRVNFMRTHEGGGSIGGVHDAGSQPAERVIFNPEFYLSKPVFKSDLIGADSYKTVLLKDLPPIY